MQQNFGPSYFYQSGGALIALQLQTGSYHYFALFYRTKQIKATLYWLSCTLWGMSCACALTLPDLIVLEQFSLGTRPHKSRMHKFRLKKLPRAATNWNVPDVSIPILDYTELHSPTPFHQRAAITHPAWARGTQNGYKIGWGLPDRMVTTDCGRLDDHSSRTS